VPESLGPSEEEDGDFARELARMITDTSADARKVDKRTAAALWDAAVLPPTARRRREDEADENTMTFTLITKRGAKQQVRAIDVPAEAPLAVQTRSAQRQDKEEQQHLKRLVLDYEQREEAEERKGRPRPIYTCVRSR
jgi:regulator of nonsense transcripts 2